MKVDVANTLWAIHNKTDDTYSPVRKWPRKDGKPIEGLESNLELIQAIDKSSSLIWSGEGVAPEFSSENHTKFGLPNLRVGNFYHHNRIGYRNKTEDEIQRELEQKAQEVAANADWRTFFQFFLTDNDTALIFDSAQPSIRHLLDTAIKDLIKGYDNDRFQAVQFAWNAMLQKTNLSDEQKETFISVINQNAELFGLPIRVSQNGSLTISLN